jgi:hypothetical protein
MVAALVLASPEPLSTDQAEARQLPIECSEPRAQLLVSAYSVDPLPLEVGWSESMTWQWCAPVQIVPLATSSL